MFCAEEGTYRRLVSSLESRFPTRPTRTTLAMMAQKAWEMCSLVGLNMPAVAWPIPPDMDMPPIPSMVWD